VYSISTRHITPHRVTPKRRVYRIGHKLPMHAPYAPKPEWKVKGVAEHLYDLSYSLHAEAGISPALKTIELGTPEPLVGLVRHPQHLLLTPEQVFERERTAFMNLRGQLLNDPNFQNKFVAIVGGIVVDSDSDEYALAQRVYREHGYVPIFIDRIEPNSEVFEIPSPELE